MTDDLRPPYRIAFDNARDPYAARNALGIASTGGGGGVPTTRTITAGAGLTGGGDLSADRTIDVGAGTGITVNANDVALTVPVSVANGGTGSNTTGGALTNLGAQPLDADLTAIAALTGTNTIYYRSAANTWSAVTVSTGLAFSGGNLTATAGASTVTAARGRLTLQTGTPVMTTTQSAKTTIFYTPYVGNQVPIYDGTTMTMTTFAELSVATTDTTKSPAAVGASQVLDWFIWSDVGTLRLGHGPAWTSDTTRSAGTALVMVAGLLLNSASITNGPAAQRGTYVGTTRSNASSQLEWTYGALAANGTAGFFGIWNAYNRVNVASFTGDSAGSWANSTTNTWRSANGSTTMRCYMVRGLDEDAVVGQYTCTFVTGGANNAAIGVGLDTTTSFNGNTGAGLVTSSVYINATATYAGLPGIGFHYLQAVEWNGGSAGAATTFVSGTTYQNGLNVQLRA